MKKGCYVAMLTMLLALGLTACSDTQESNRVDGGDVVSSGKSVEKTKESNYNGGDSENSQQEDAQSETQSGGVSNDHRVISTDGRFYGEWLDDGYYGVKYQGDGYIIAIFNGDGILDHFKEFDASGELTWSCDWEIFDVRDEEHEYCVGYNHMTGENIMRTYDLDYELIWPMEYDEYQPDLVAVNQQFVTVAGDKFTLWWRTWRDSEDGYYYKFEDRNFTKVEEGR